MLVHPAFLYFKLDHFPSSLQQVSEYGEPSEEIESERYLSKSLPLACQSEGGQRGLYNVSRAACPMSAKVTGRPLKSSLINSGLRGMHQKVPWRTLRSNPLWIGSIWGTCYSRPGANWMIQQAGKKKKKSSKRHLLKACVTHAWDNYHTSSDLSVLAAGTLSVHPPCSDSFCILPTDASCQFMNHQASARGRLREQESS